MATFPRTEVDIVTQAEAMLAGFLAHEADFPSVDPAALTALIHEYKTARTEQEDAYAQALLATKRKKEKIALLVRGMKNDLKRSEADTSDHPEKLFHIHWSVKHDPTPTLPPNQPTNLTPTLDTNGTYTLRWDKPSNGSTGGPVRNYLVQNRVKTNGQIGPWRLVDTTYDRQLRLPEPSPELLAAGSDQTTQQESAACQGPTSVGANTAACQGHRQVEYRVKASNVAGESNPSNVATVVL